MRRIVALVRLPCLVFLATLASSSQVASPTTEIKPPDLALILQRLEDIQHQDPAQSRPYDLTREYKVFHGSDEKPTSEVIAQINFVPPDMKAYKITQARGNSRGAKMVRELLDRETESAKKGKGSEVNRTNYDFVFLRQENFGDVPEYVLGTLPKRKDRNLLRGQIWVDASSFRIRRIEGVPAKSPSFWLKNIHITLQFAATRRDVRISYLRRCRDSPVIGTVPTCSPHYPILRILIRCAITLVDGVRPILNL